MLNPILILGAFAAAGLLWLLCSFLYRPLGRLGLRLFNDAKEEINKEDKENIKTNEENKGE